METLKAMQPCAEIAIERNQECAAMGVDVLDEPEPMTAIRIIDQDMTAVMSFWNIRNRHASWTMPRRTRALPDRASPFSRRFLPLSSGEPVRPP